MMNWTNTHTHTHTHKQTTHTHTHTHTAKYINAHTRTHKSPHVWQGASRTPGDKRGEERRRGGEEERNRAGHDRTSQHMAQAERSKLDRENKTEECTGGGSSLGSEQSYLY